MLHHVSPVHQPLSVRLVHQDTSLVVETVMHAKLVVHHVSHQDNHANHAAPITY